MHVYNSKTNSYKMHYFLSQIYTSVTCAPKYITINDHWQGKCGHTLVTWFSVQYAATKYTEYCHLQPYIHTEHNGARLSCDVCGKVYSTKLGLSGHMPEHTGDLKYKCKICLKGLRYQHAFEEHVDGHDNFKRLKMQYIFF